MNDNMTIRELKAIINDLDDDMIVVIPVTSIDDADDIRGFRKVRTAGILVCEQEIDSEAFCINAATENYDIADQMRFVDTNVSVKEVLYGKAVEQNG